MKILTILKNIINYGAKIAICLLALLGLAMSGEASRKEGMLLNAIDRLNNHMSVIDTKLDHINNKIDHS